MQLSDSSVPDVSTVSHFFTTTSCLAWTNTVWVKHPSNGDVPSSHLPIKPYNFQVWIGNALALCSCLVCSGKCLFWNMPLSEWLDFSDGHLYMDRVELEVWSHYFIAQQSLPFQPLAPNLGSVSRRVLRLLVSPWRLLIEPWASASSPCLCFLGCAATVIGNYRCVGEDGYWWTVPPLSFLFTQAQHWGCLNSQYHHKVPRV